MSDFALQFIPGEDEEKKKPARQTGLVEQGMSGVNEGIAQALGFPVDMATMALNAGIGGVNKLSGAQIPQIQDPVGGSGTMTRMLDPTISDVDPQSAGQRYARRIGQELGFGVPMSGAMAATGPLAPLARTSLPTYMAGNTAADVGAGVAGQTSREIAPNSDALDLVVSLIGGGVGAKAVDSAMTRKPQVPTRADVETRTNQLYDAVKNSGADLTPQAQADLNTRLRQKFAAEGGDPLAYPKTNAQLNVIENNPRQSIYGVEQARRRVRDKVARSPDEAAMGGDIMAEVDAYLRGLQPGDISSNAVDPQEVVEALGRARSSAHQGIKADEVQDAINRAQSRTETTGTAGNSLNAQSQEIRKLYDKEVSLRNPQKSGGYSPDEVEAMKKIVFPSGTERTMQRIGRFAPTTGSLQAHMSTGVTGGGVIGALATGNPLYALAAAPSIVGVGAQALAERSKDKNIKNLIATILNDGLAPKAKKSSAAQAAIISQILNAQPQ